MKLTQAYLKECFDYDPETGNLIWKERPRSHFKSRIASHIADMYTGTAAGCMMPNGYRNVSISGKTYRLHRVVWFWHHGSFPVRELDHVNRIKTDNRIGNLRECSNRQNNCARRSKNTSGVRGARITPSGRWRATIWVSGKSCNLGTFSTARDAALAYARAAVDHFGAFAPIEAKELFNEAYP